MPNSGSWLQFSRDGTSNTWQTGMSSDGSYVIRASALTNVVTVNQNGNVALTGHLDVGVGATSSNIQIHGNGTYTNNLIRQPNISVTHAMSDINLDTNASAGYINFKVKGVA